MNLCKDDIHPWRTKRIVVDGKANCALLVTECLECGDTYTSWKTRHNDANYFAHERLVKEGVANKAVKLTIQKNTDTLIAMGSK